MLSLIQLSDAQKRYARILFWLPLGVLFIWAISRWAVQKLDHREVATAAELLAPEFEPFTGTDWSANHPNEGRQSFDAFIQICPLESDDLSNPICILPLGAMTPSESKFLKTTAEYLGVFYNRPVQMLPSNLLDHLPEHARRIHPEWGNEQFLAGYLLTNYVQPTAPDSAVATLGFTMTDLWPGPGWNFVFGLARLGNRIGVHSLQKHGNPNGSEDEQRAFLRRSLKVAAHETGHMFGIPHCIAYHCAMNGTNGIDDTDRSPLMFCPECLQKIWWANDIEPGEWFGQLETFLRREGLITEAEQCAKLAKRLNVK